MKKLCALRFFFFFLFVPYGLFAQQSPQLPALKQEAVEEVDKLGTLTQQMVDEIFSFSELGFQEFETSRYVTGILGKNGFHVEQGVAGVPTAWVATYGSGKPVIAFITDIDCIPRASQKPGVAFHDPIVVGAPGHGEGHNSGMAVNVTSALALKKLMDEHHIAGTIKLVPGVAEELLGTKAFYVRAGLFKDVDLVLGAHVESEFSTSYGTGNGEWSGLVSVQYFFHGKAAHAAAAPWEEAQRAGCRGADGHRLGLSPRTPASCAALSTSHHQWRRSAQCCSLGSCGLVLLPRAGLSTHQGSVRPGKYDCGFRDENVGHDR
jgi:aminobenzoyl-glutamate utilization protein B